MKKILFIMLNILVILATSMVTTTTYSANAYLQNSYGALLKYILADPSSSPVEKPLPINGRSLLGEINLISHLYIRTTGMGESYLSPYYNLTPYLVQAKEQQKANPNSEAVIDISSSFGRWYITIYWEKKSATLQTTSMTRDADIAIDEAEMQLIKEINLLSTKNPAIQLDHIKKGALGQMYANRVTAICSTNYTTAQSSGFLNLCQQLEQDLKQSTYTTDPKTNPAIIRPAINEIKRKIDTIHNQLINYRATKVVK